MTRNTAEMLFGALIADAATLGVHWLYDPDRIADIATAQNGRTAFTPVDAANYADTKGYFAHAARKNGQQTQYGEVLHLALQVIDREGAFDVAAYQAAFTAHFGAGGSYHGYIDRPTRGALARIEAQESPSGIDDDQLPALATLPAILARYVGAPDADSLRLTAMEVTNVNDIAVQYGDACADVLTRVLSGETLPEALNAAAAAAHSDIRDVLSHALTTNEMDSTVYAGHTGRACHLPMAGPLMFHILARSNSFAEAIERNNLAGGDNAGRSVFLGAVMGACHGVGSDTGVPLEWALQLEGRANVWRLCQSVADRAA